MADGLVAKPRAWPFRWLSDISVIEAFEFEALKLSDFYFTGDDYRYRFEPGAKRRFIDLIRDRFNSGVDYNGKILKWDTIIEQKASELGRLLVSSSSAIDFADPSPKLVRQDTQQLRERILALSQGEAKELGIGKSTLHYLRKNAQASRSFRTYCSVGKKLKRVMRSDERIGIRPADREDYVLEERSDE